MRIECEHCGSIFEMGRWRRVRAYYCDCLKDCDDPECDGFECPKCGEVCDLLEYIWTWLRVGTRHEPV